MKQPQNPHGDDIPPSFTVLASFEYFAERAKPDTYEGQAICGDLLTLLAETDRLRKLCQAAGVDPDPDLGTSWEGRLTAGHLKERDARYRALRRKLRQGRA